MCAHSEKLLGFILAQQLSDSSSPEKTYRIYTIDYSRLHVNCLKTVLITAADTYMAHIWQYPHPPPQEYFLPLSACWSLKDHNQARSKQKMTGGAERVAHINSPPPPAPVPRLKYPSWYMSPSYICLQCLLFLSLIFRLCWLWRNRELVWDIPVSYTHLTLPTKRIV